MQRDVNLRRYILQVFSSPNVVAFASEKARSVLDVEFGVSLGSLLRPFGVESPSKFLWAPDEASRKTREYLSDPEWRGRACRESSPTFLALKDVFHNKPRGSPRVWAPQNRIEQVTINMQGREYRNEDFEVRFVSLCESAEERDDSLGCLEIKAIRSYGDFMRQFPYSDLVSSSLLNSGSKQFESIFKEFLQNEFEVNTVDDLMEFNCELPFWFERWLEAYSESFSFLNHESISQPIGGIVFVDISEDDPIESIIEITQSLKTGKGFEKLGGNPGYYLFGGTSRTGLIQDSSYLPDTGRMSKPHYLQESYLSDFPLIYIFINDEKSNFDLTEADHNIISSFKLSFPESICYIWNIKGHPTGDEIQDPDQVVWPGTFSHPYKDASRPFVSNRYFGSDEMEQLNSFIIDSIKNSFVPWLEETINRLCNHVIQSRKGFKNHLRILWRRPRNDSSSNSDGLLSTLGVGSTFSNMEERSQIFDHEISLFSSKSGSSSGGHSKGGASTSTCIYYSSGSLEGQTRLVADLCLVSGLYSQSVQYYKQVLSEYKLDKSFLHIGSTFFSMGVAEILSEFDLETATDHCINSANSFLRNGDEIGTIMAIKSLLFLGFLILSTFRMNSRSPEHSASQDLSSSVINNACKSIIGSLSKISSEFQISQPGLRPRSLFSVSKMDSQDHSRDSTGIQYLTDDLQWVPTHLNDLRRRSMWSTFGVINYVISKAIFLSSSLSDSSFKAPNSSTNISHSWSIYTAQAAQVFQDLECFGISLKQYLTTLLHMDRFAYKHINRYLKLHSARLCQKLSLFSQSTLLYSSLILDLINDKISFRTEGLSSLRTGNEPNWLQINNQSVLSSLEEEDTEISLICYREFARSYVIYRQWTSQSIQGSESCQTDSPSVPSPQITGPFLKIPLPVLLPLGAALILETDSDSLFKAFGQSEHSGPGQSSCICNNKIQQILDQKNFCNHFSKMIKIDVPGTGYIYKSRYENTSKSFSPSYYSNNRAEEDFQNLLDRVNRLLESESLESSEATELRSQYLLRRNKECHWLNGPKPSLISSSQLSSSVRFSFIKKVCSIEVHLYNPLSFPIVCESLQIWGHLRLYDGSTGVTHTLKGDTDDYNHHKYSKGILFFEKSTILNPNETKIQRLSVIPLEAGELFLVGISFLLDGKIPIRQKFGASFINPDGLASKLDQLGYPGSSSNSSSNLNPSKIQPGIQKVNILGNPNNSSIYFGEISQKSNNEQGTERYRDLENIKNDQESRILYSGVPYDVPISISSKEGADLSLRDSVLLVVPNFSNSFNIQMRQREARPEGSVSFGSIGSPGCVFRLPMADVHRIHEFDLTLWVNSECSGNVYFVLLNSSGLEESSGGGGGPTQSSSSRSKINRSIVLANLSFCFRDSVSMSCTVFPGQRDSLSRLLLRIRNEVPRDVVICDVSANPSKWVEKYPTEMEATMIQERPVLTLSQRNGLSKDFLNGDGGQIGQLKKIPANGTFQIFLDLESNDQITFSVSKINLVLSWAISADPSYLEMPDQTGVISGQICVYNVNLFDPYSIPFNGYKTGEDKYHPLSIEMDTRDLDLPESSPYNEDIRLIEANIKLTNITINSTIICSLICNSRSLTSQNFHEDLLIPRDPQIQAQHSPRIPSPRHQNDECSYLSRQISSVLESGELKWVGQTVTHIKLHPRSSKTLKLIALMPFKGIFSTNTIQLLVRERYPFFPNYIRPRRKGDLSSSHSPTIGSQGIFFYICYMNWVPPLFKDPSTNPITKCSIKTYQDFLAHRSYIKGKMSPNNGSGNSKNKSLAGSNNNRSLLPAYIENKGSSNKKHSTHQGKTESSDKSESRDSLATQQHEANINQLNAINLDKWLTNEESAYVNAGSIHILNYSNTYGVMNLPQKYIKRRQIIQKPHRPHLLIRM
ncbi:hypothetical protein OIY81_3279 [Cryptosporidium canis]|nr:hypothetical protein OIY81_3279 [Cryptosporidium canis]